MTKIQWVRNADGTQGKTWNIVTGCTKIAAGCKNCYAERMAKRLAGRCGYPADEPFRVTLHPERLNEPLNWRKPRTIFVCSMGDLFHEDVPDDFIGEVFAVMDGERADGTNARHHTYQILTKRPERMRDYMQAFRDTSGGYVPPNVHLGVSASTQEDADALIPILLETPAAVRFVSLEPLLSRVDLYKWLDSDRCVCCGLSGCGNEKLPCGCSMCYICLGRGHDEEHACTNGNSIDWVIVGSESGPHRRPCKLEWIENIVRQCEEAGTPVFVKQAEINGKLVKMPEVWGRVWDGLPLFTDA